MKETLKEKKPYYLTLTRKFIFYLVSLLLAYVIIRLIFDENARTGRLLFYIAQFVGMLIVLRLSKFIEDRFHFKVPYLLDFSLITFAFCGFILGDTFDFYGKFPIWDSILHTFSGILIAYVGFIVIRYLDQEYRIPLSISPMFMSVIVVSVALSLGAMWEIGEYLVDDITGANNQQYMATTRGTLYSKEDQPLLGHEALKDTMKDLMLDLAGAVFVASVGYHQLQKRKEEGEAQIKG